MKTPDALASSKLGSSQLSSVGSWQLRFAICDLRFASHESEVELEVQTKIAKRMFEVLKRTAKTRSKTNLSAGHLFILFLVVSPRSPDQVFLPRRANPFSSLLISSPFLPSRSSPRQDSSFPVSICRKPAFVSYETLVLSHFC